MATPEDVLKIARSYIGVKEYPAHSNKTMFGDWYGWNGVAWCAIFVSYCFYRAKMSLAAIRPPNTKGFAYCPYGVEYFKKKEKLDQTPQVGDIVFFDWDKDAVANHVGIVEKVLSPSKVVCIEGNTSYTDNSNGGEVMRRTRYLSTILGFAHPEYNGIPLKEDDTDAPTWPGRYIMLTSPNQQGEDIRVWQEQMIENGYDLGPTGADGLFGAKSNEALLKFQRDRGLVDDCVIGEITWNETWRKL
jgi:hypothetical protein